MTTYIVLAGEVDAPPPRLAVLLRVDSQRLGDPVSLHFAAASDPLKSLGNVTVPSLYLKAKLTGRSFWQVRRKGRRIILPPLRPGGRG